MRKNKIIAMIAASSMLLTAVPANTFAKFMFIQYPMLECPVPYHPEVSTPDVPYTNEELAALNDKWLADVVKDLEDYTFEDLISMTDEEICAISNNVHGFFHGAYPKSSQQIGYGFDALQFCMEISSDNPYYDAENCRDFDPTVILNDLGLPSEIVVNKSSIHPETTLDTAEFSLRYKDYPLEFLYPRVALTVLKNKNTPENPVNDTEWFSFYIIPYAEGQVSVQSGDVDGDGEITLSDAVAAASYIANPDKYPLDFKRQAAADTADYGDGVNAADVVAIQRYLLEDVDDLPVSYAE